jgi:isochorismate hydrolase
VIAQPPVNEEDQQALALLADLQRYVADPADDLKRELAQANAALARTRTDANRIRLAMLLTLPAAGPPDDARALSLLEPLVSKTSTNSPLKQIATVLHSQIIERARTVREEQKRTAAAQEKLDALRAVERSLLLERSRNAGGGSAGGGGGTGR